LSQPAPAPKPRRFYKAVEVVPADDGFAVRLDGRSAKSPGGRPLAAPTEAMAGLLAAEWEAQANEIDLAAMPATRLAFTALDRGEEARAAMAEEVARYAGSDLLCYLAEEPQVLAEREAERWGPWLAWSKRELGVTLTPSIGISPARQSPGALARATALAAEMDAFALTGLTFAAALYGSAVLAFAVARGALDGEAAFELSRLDEAFQEERWGVDAEAAARTERLRADARLVHGWFATLRG
jgi:chaperone required for assembly of F1-ATPase